MESGFYAIYYTGLAGSGFGLFAMTDGSIVGVDASGGSYDGHYELKKDMSELTGNLTLKVPPGTPLVTGVVVQNEANALNIPLCLPAEFGNGKPLTIQTPTGPVNVIFKRLRDLMIKGANNDQH